MPQKDPKVVITDADGDLVPEHKPRYHIVTTRKPTPETMEIRRRAEEHHTVFEVWVPNRAIIDAPTEISAMLTSADLTILTKALVRIVKFILDSKGVPDAG